MTSEYSILYFTRSLIPLRWSFPPYQRFTVTSTYTTVDDLSRDWTIIRAVASEVLSKTPAEEHKAKVFLKGGCCLSLFLSLLSYTCHYCFPIKIITSHLLKQTRVRIQTSGHRFSSPTRPCRPRSSTVPSPPSLTTMTFSLSSPRSYSSSSLTFRTPPARVGQGLVRKLEGTCRKGAIPIYELDP